MRGREHVHSKVKQTNINNKSTLILPEKETMSYRSGSQDAVPRLVASPAHENMLEMLSLGSQSRPTESDTIGSGPALSSLTNPTSDSDEPQCLRITELFS